jgi:hypothetical protein
VDLNQLYSAAEVKRMMKLHEVLLKTMAGKMRTDPDLYRGVAGLPRALF